MALFSHGGSDHNAEISFRWCDFAHAVSFGGTRTKGVGAKTNRRYRLKRRVRDARDRQAGKRSHALTSRRVTARRFGAMRSRTSAPALRPHRWSTACLVHERRFLTVKRFILTSAVS